MSLCRQRTYFSCNRAMYYFWRTITTLPIKASVLDHNVSGCSIQMDSCAKFISVSHFFPILIVVHDMKGKAVLDHDRALDLEISARIWTIFDITNEGCNVDHRSRRPQIWQDPASFITSGNWLFLTISALHQKEISLKIKPSNLPETLEHWNILLVLVSISSTQDTRRKYSFTSMEQDTSLFLSLMW